MTVDDAIRSLVDLGPGALMDKFDVKPVYRNVPIHPDDRFLLGMKWRDLFYVDLVLPFGSRSSPFIFNSVAEAVEWILANNYAICPLFHYLEDFWCLWVSSWIPSRSVPVRPRTRWSASFGFSSYGPERKPVHVMTSSP